MTTDKHIWDAENAALAGRRNGDYAAMAMAMGQTTGWLAEVRRGYEAGDETVLCMARNLVGAVYPENPVLREEYEQGFFSSFWDRLLSLSPPMDNF